MAAVGIALRFYMLRAWSKRKPVLHSITYSHFVERVRWAMHRIGYDYEEEQSIGILGILMQARTVPRLVVHSQRTVLGSSDDILTYLWSHHQGQPELVAFLAPTPEVVAMEAELSEVFGEHARRWLYFHSLSNPEIGMAVWGINEEKIPAWQRMLLPYLYPVLVKALRALLKITENGAERSLKKVQSFYDILDERLSDGRPYLMGDKLTRADITLASLGSLTVFRPDNYTGGRSPAPFPADDLPDQLRAETIKFRARPTGKLILKLYEQERMKTIPADKKNE